MKWIKIEDKLPPDDQYILVRLINHEHWHCKKNGTYRVVLCIYGISNIDREKMINGELPDPIIGYNGAKRSQIFQRGDEWANNHRNYAFEEFGPGSFFGQDVSHWMLIPELPVN